MSPPVQNDPSHALLVVGMGIVGHQKDIVTADDQTDVFHTAPGEAGDSNEIDLVAVGIRNAKITLEIVETKGRDLEGKLGLILVTRQRPDAQLFAVYHHRIRSDNRAQGKANQI